MNKMNPEPPKQEDGLMQMKQHQGAIYLSCTTLLNYLRYFKQKSKFKTEQETLQKVIASIELWERMGLENIGTGTVEEVHEFEQILAGERARIKEQMEKLDLDMTLDLGDIRNVPAERLATFAILCAELQHIASIEATLKENGIPQINP